MVVRYYEDSNRFETLEGKAIETDDIFDALPEEMQNKVFSNMDETFNLIEGLLDEDYPSSFSMVDFKTINSFNGRKKYCEEHLQRISSGSSRIVYKIDNEKVLKLAYNKKGIGQNEVEIEYSQYGDIEDVVARTLKHHPENLWVERELAKKVRVADFQKVTGFKFSDYQKAIHNYGVDSGNSRGGYKQDIDPKIVEAMWESEFTYAMFDFIGNYGIPVGDLGRLNSYGLVKRNGSDTIVMIDYGLTHDVYDSYYS